MYYEYQITLVYVRSKWDVDLEWKARLAKIRQKG